MPPTKKRKNEEAAAEETPIKRSKKEARELAMKRAKEAMLADKLKVEAVKAKKQQGGSKDDDGKMASTPAKRPKAAEKRLAAKTSAQKPAAAAKASAKTSAAKKPKSNEAPMPAQAPVVPAQAAGMASPAMAAANPPTNGMNPATMGFGMQPGAPMNQQGVSQAMMAQFMMGQQQRMMGQQPQGMMGGPPVANMGQQPYGGGFGGQFAAQYAHMNVNPQQQAAAQQQAAQQQMQAQSAAAQPTNPVVQPEPPTQKPEANVVPTIAPASTSKKIATAIPESDDDDDDDDMPPPPTASLEMQISQQVLANVAAHANNEPTPFNVPPPEAFTQLSSSQPDDDVEEEVYDDQPIIVDDDEIPPLVQKRRTWGRGLIAAIVVGILSYVIMMGGDGSEDLLAQQSPAKLDDSDADCYFDSVVGDGEDYVPACADQPGAPCPEGSVCSGGKIVECQYWFEAVADDGKSCGLPVESQKTLETIIRVLEEKSVEAECNLFSFQSRPLFDYAQVQLANPLELATNPLELAVLEKELVSERYNGKFYIGLPEDHPLELSAACKAAASVKSFIGLIGSLIFLAMHSVLSGLWSACSAYPLASLVGFVMVWLAKKRRDYQAHRSKLVRDIATVRQTAYEILQDSPNDSHIVLHIRDQIAMAMYPDSNSKRQYLFKEVWPRIIPNFIQDNRVRKSTRVIDGKPRDVWQWVAVTSTKKPAAAAASEQ